MKKPEFGLRLRVALALALACLLVVGALGFTLYTASEDMEEALIKQLVSAENTLKPLSDGQLSDILAQQGIVVARRTVAKYREDMRIPSTHQRRVKT